MLLASSPELPAADLVDFFAAWLAFVVDWFAFLAVDLAGDFLADDFLAGDFFADCPVVFLVADFVAVDFLAGDFLAVDFLAGDFFAVLFFVVLFLVVLFLAGDDDAALFASVVATVNCLQVNDSATTVRRGARP
jgi:hypothetical protein